MNTAGVTMIVASSPSSDRCMMVEKALAETVVLYSFLLSHNCHLLSYYTQKMKKINSYA